MPPIEGGFIFPLYTTHTSPPLSPALLPPTSPALTPSPAPHTPTTTVSPTIPTLQSPRQSPPDPPRASSPADRVSAHSNFHAAPALAKPSSESSPPAVVGCLDENAHASCAVSLGAYDQPGNQETYSTQTQTP